MELIDPPMCCKLKFIRMYNTDNSCRRTILYVCMLVCKSRWLDFELITRFIVSKWVEDVLFLYWELSLPQPQGSYHVYVGWTNHGESHSQARILSWQTSSLQPSITKTPILKRKVDQQKTESHFTRWVITYERWGTKTDATSNPSLILSNQHKLQLVFSNCSSFTRTNQGQTKGTLL